jgi:hypothetical protein
MYNYSLHISAYNVTHLTRKTSLSRQESALNELVFTSSLFYQDVTNTKMKNNLAI